MAGELFTAGSAYRALEAAKLAPSFGLSNVDPVVLEARSHADLAERMADEPNTTFYSISTCLHSILQGHVTRWPPKVWRAV